MATETIHIDSIEGYEQEQVEKIQSLLNNTRALNHGTETVLEIGESSGWNSGSGANVYEIQDIINDPIGTLIGSNDFNATFEIHDTGAVFLEFDYSHHDGGTASKFILRPQNSKTMCCVDTMSGSLIGHGTLNRTKIFMLWPQTPM